MLRSETFQTTLVVVKENENDRYYKKGVPEMLDKAREDITTNEKIITVAEKIQDNMNKKERGEVRTLSNGVNDEFSETIRTITDRMTSLSEGERRIFSQLLRNYQVLFSDKPGCAKGYEHRLKLTTSHPKIRHTYPAPFQLREATGRAIEKMVEAGVIERAISHFCNPLRIVGKEDGTVRVCLDARLINKVIEDDQESPPLVNELLQKFHAASWFSKTDLTHGYWQIPLHVESRPYTVFLFWSKLYQFRRIPFGLKTAGSGFIRALSNAMGEEFSANVSCYIDDILIGTDTFDEHVIYDVTIRVMSGIFRRLTEHNFTLKLSKCSFFQKQVPFVGFIITNKGIMPAPKKMEVIRKFAEPNNKKQLRQFLGVCNYYRQFNIQQSRSVDPLRELLKKDIPWLWTQKHTEVFETLKRDFANCITLKHIILGAQFRVQTDASDQGIRGILY